ncbi:signal transduction histidine kinase [Desulfosporosinus acidiphilus SJ4]|uniref:histidine kinase n=1 Tax=Desulfosporosinus acidiphilus (strain DSM 22704 / JCM 16185 / SJ4) TaxID=646529 RepID=I4D0M0_DESAJ|nr:HAMP domain-containing sensor histidine kinase [Desulfosporosinus acidiphilus]AFM39344.1 signal transduction histidine kinase [Desulfosporosinus acidiphilus SJ4]
MDLKKRMILANASTVIIPMVITVFIAVAFLFIYCKMSGNDLSFKDYQRLSQIKLELLNTETGILQRSPEVVEEDEFQKHLQERLAEIQGELVIIKDGKMIFSSINLSKIDLEKSLDAGNMGRNEPIVIGDMTYSVQSVGLQFKDGTKGRVLLLAPLDQAATNLTRFIIIIGVTFVLLFMLTNILVSYHFSRRILKPLRNLQSAAAEISRGNLDQAIVEEGDQEIQALCRDLELMRLKLKDSVYSQLKYEDNRKMIISSISHDLKTPVTSIKGYVEGILDGIANTPEKMERYLKTISLKAHQVDQMIDDLLLYAKLDLNQIPFDFEKTDIGEYLKLCLLESEPELESSHIKVSLHIDLPQKQFVSLDRARMKRVIVNILDNSRKYMNKEQGEIKILLRDTFTSLIIELRDNGSGVSEGDLPHIFDRFYRSDKARSKGSGLGLAIAKQIVEGHKGRIWAVSHGEEGTSIMISLSKS